MLPIVKMNPWGKKFSINAFSNFFSLLSQMLFDIFAVSCKIRKKVFICAPAAPLISPFLPTLSNTLSDTFRNFGGFCVIKISVGNNKDGRQRVRGRDTGEGGAIFWRK